MKVTKVSPLAPDSFPVLPVVRGVRSATVASGIRYSGCDDLTLIAVDPGTTVAGVFTRSLCPAAPVDWCRWALAQTGGRARALICNTGNANAFTGAAGYAVSQRTAEAVAAAFDAEAAEIMVTSTGVIAEPLDVERITTALPQLVAELSEPDPAAWEAAATAIGTTDTYAKGAAAKVNGTAAHVVGIAKGSGMIAPDMATMLAFIFTDLNVDPQTAQECLTASVGKSFNRITVDSDTSTSDMAMLFCTGKVDVGGDGDTVDAFQAALDTVTLDLAHQIVKDGEGATKFVQITVTGAASDEAAEVIARTIADSPLVKTALAASDANWGRIVAAVGKAGQQADRDRLAIWIGDEQCADAGLVCDGYSEERGHSAPFGF